MSVLFLVGFELEHTTSVNFFACAERERERDLPPGGVLEHFLFAKVTGTMLYTQVVNVAGACI